MINRGAVILKYTEFAIQWLNDNDPFNDNPGISLEDTLNDGATIYLISEGDAESEDNVEKWIKNNFKPLFESELEGWFADETLWPKKLTLTLFKKWFTYSWHSMVEDTVELPIYDDED
ncbi:MAG: hypothetical protein HQL46_14465 [Gammaproteobacteria bacterium]|nr:hypothetical protein [Gammaproteobacteria bacterium]